MPRVLFITILQVYYEENESSILRVNFPESFDVSRGGLKSQRYFFDNFPNLKQSENLRSFMRIAIKFLTECQA